MSSGAESVRNALQPLARLDWSREPAGIRYGVAVLLVGAALAGNLLPFAGQKLPFIFFFAAVALTARVCGFGPALLASLFSAVLADFFFLGTQSVFSFAPSDLVQLFIFLFVSTIVASVALQKSVAQTAAGASERRLQFTQVAAGVGSWEWNLKTSNLWWADGIWVLHGRAIGSIQPSYENWISFVHPEDRERCQQAIQKSQTTGRDYEVEYRTIWPDGRIRWIIARGQVRFDQHGKPERMLGLSMDITDRKLAEEALRRSEKLAAAGRLAATIAHEINNPLEAVTNLLYLLRYCDLDSAARNYVAQAEHELARMAHVTRQTLGFYRDTTAPLPVDLRTIADEVLALYARRFESKGITVIRDYESEVRVTVLPGEIRQVISNLVANAIDAMEKDGKLHVRVHRGREFVNAHMQGGFIVVADSGNGIPREQRKRVFEPFYTTKEDVGTGLGLWVSREIVNKHGGKIRFRSSTGGEHSGTVFSVFLPEKSEASGFAATGA